MSGTNQPHKQIKMKIALIRSSSEAKPDPENYKNNVPGDSLLRALADFPRKSPSNLLKLGL